MEFIKKHYEKILLVVTLLVLIGSAAFLVFKVSALSEEIADAPHRPKPKGQSAQPGDLAVYSNALASLQSPPLWQDRGPLFPETKILFEPKTNIVLVATNQIAVLQIEHKPFKLIFRSYTGHGQNFQVDFLTGRRSFFVEKVGMEIADKFGGTGYVISKFEQKFTPVFNKSLNVTNEVDISELTIQHPGEDPIVMVLNTVKEEKEPVATVQCPDGVQSFLVRRGQEFKCIGKTYNVVDITSTQVIILEKISKEKRTISLPDVRK